MDAIPTCKTFATRMPHYNYYSTNIGLPSFPLPNVLRTEFAKLCTHQTFLLYGIAMLKPGSFSYHCQQKMPF